MAERMRMIIIAGLALVASAGWTDGRAQAPLALGTATPEAVVFALSGPAADPRDCAQPRRVDIPDIHFDHDSDRLTSESRAKLAILANAMRSFPFDRFVLEGHTSASGSDDYNLRLSFRRAEAVRAGLSANTSPISIRGFGKTRLLYPDDPEHPHNRRVTVVRLPGISPAIQAVQAGDDGRHDIAASVHAYAAGETKSYVVDSDQKRFRTGDAFHLCVSVSRPGLLTVLNQAPGSGERKPIGTWSLAAGAVQRVPATGVFRMDGRAGTEVLHLIHQVCGQDAAALATGLESIVLSPPVCPTRVAFESIILSGTGGRGGPSTGTVTRTVVLQHDPNGR
ncbi:OmpA family protein [Azospirillum griseum]|nr:OmpA family protein [Azospirillum griseum]